MTKREVLAMISELPEEATAEDILYALYVRTSIEEGLRDVDEGRTLSLEEARTELRRWRHDA